MSSVAVSLIVFACIFGGALLGMLLRTLLPQHHLSADSKDLVKLGMGVIATMSALVLSLLISSAKGSYDVQRNELTQMSANVVLLDSLLAHYGPEAGEARELFRRIVAGAIDRMWPATGSQSAQLAPTSASEGFYDKLQKLSPKDEAGRLLKAEALKMSTDLRQTRWLLFEQSGSSIPLPFLVILVTWLTLIFTSFSLFTPPNATVVAALLICALSISGAILLILELDQPFEGLIQISSAPLRRALSQLGR